jgi:hypothetical protein
MTKQRSENETVDDGLFMFNSGPKCEYLPREIVHHILQFVLPYPCYVALRRVSKQWLQEMNNHVMVGLISHILTHLARNNGS